MEMKFNRLDDLAVEACYALPPTGRASSPLALQTKRGLVVFKPSNMSKNKNMLDISQLSIEILPQRPEEAELIVQLETPVQIEELQSPIPLGTTSLTYSGRVKDPWFESELFICSTILQFKLGPYEIQFYYRFSQRSPEKFTDWVVSDTRPETSPLPVFVIDAQVPCIVGRITNAVFTTGDVVGMVLMRDGFIRMDLKTDISAEIIQDGKKQGPHRPLTLPKFIQFVAE